MIFYNKGLESSELYEILAFMPKFNFFLIHNQVQKRAVKSDNTAG